MRQRLFYLVKVYLLTVVLFIVAKVVFMLSNSEEHAFTASDIWQVVRHGLSLDLSTSLYPFWGFKLDASCLQYLETPTEAGASVSAFYIIIRILLLTVGAYIL